MRNGEGPPVTCGELISALRRYPGDSIVTSHHDNISVKTPDGVSHFDLGCEETPKSKAKLYVCVLKGQIPVLALDVVSAGRAVMDHMKPMMAEYGDWRWTTEAISEVQKVDMESDDVILAGDLADEANAKILPLTNSTVADWLRFLEENGQ